MLLQNKQKQKNGGKKDHIVYPSLVSVRNVNINRNTGRLPSTTPLPAILGMKGDHKHRPAAKVVLTVERWLYSVEQNQLLTPC